MRDHAISETKSPIGFTLRCRCGWTRSFRRENALARAAKMKAAYREHDRDIEKERAREADSLAAASAVNSILSHFSP